MSTAQEVAAMSWSEAQAWKKRRKVSHYKCQVHLYLQENAEIKKVCQELSVEALSSKHAKLEVSSALRGKFGESLKKLEILSAKKGA